MLLIPQKRVWKVLTAAGVLLLLYVGLHVVFRMGMVYKLKDYSAYVECPKGFGALKSPLNVLIKVETGFTPKLTFEGGLTYRFFDSLSSWIVLKIHIKPDAFTREYFSRMLKSPVEFQGNFRLIHPFKPTLMATLSPIESKPYSITTGVEFWNAYPVTLSLEKAGSNWSGKVTTQSGGVLFKSMGLRFKYFEAEVGAVVSFLARDVELVRVNDEGRRVFVPARLVNGTIDLQNTPGKVRIELTSNESPHPSFPLEFGFVEDQWKTRTPHSKEWKDPQLGWKEAMELLQP